LVKSKNNAVTMTTATMNTVLVIAVRHLPSNSRQILRDGLVIFPVLSVPD